MEIEDDRVRERADLLEAALGDALLLQHGQERHDGDDHRHRGGGDEELVAADELRCAVAEGRAARGDGMAVEMAADVVGEFIHRGVAAVRIGIERDEEDAIEIAAKRAQCRRCCWRAAARCRQCDECFRTGACR